MKYTADIEVYSGENLILDTSGNSIASFESTQDRDYILKLLNDKTIVLPSEKRRIELL